MSFHCHVCSQKRIEAYTPKAKTNAKVFPGIASLESTKTNHRHVLLAKVKFSAILAHCNLLQHPGSFFVGASIARLNGHKKGSFFLPWLLKALHTNPGSQPQFTKWWFLLVKLLEPPGPKNGGRLDFQLLLKSPENLQNGGWMVRMTFHFTFGV